MRTLYGLMTLFVLFFVGIGSSYALTYEGVLRVVDIDDHSVTLSWDADASSMGYIVYYDYTDALDAESPQYFQESDPTTDTMIEVEGLEASTKYSFVVVSLDAE